MVLQLLVDSLVKTVIKLNKSVPLSLGIYRLERLNKVLTAQQLHKDSQGVRTSFSMPLFTLMLYNQSTPRVT